MSLSITLNVQAFAQITTKIPQNVNISSSNINNPYDACQHNRVLASSTSFLTFYSDNDSLIDAQENFSPFGSRLMFWNSKNVLPQFNLSSDLSLLKPIMLSYDGSKAYIKSAVSLLEVTNSQSDLSVSDIFSDASIVNERYYSSSNNDIFSESSNKLPDINPKSVRSIKILTPSNLIKMSLSDKKKLEFQFSKPLFIPNYIRPHQVIRPNFYRDKNKVMIDFLGLNSEKLGIPYSLSIIDRKSNKKVGYFNPKNVKSQFISKKAIESFLVRLNKDSIALSIDYADDNLVVIFQSTTGQKSISRIDKNGVIRETEICKRRKNIEAGDYDISVDFIPDTSSHIKIARFLFVSNKNSRKCLIAYYHGGPAKTVYANGNIPEEFYSLSATKCDIMLLEYPGSVGTGRAQNESIKALNGNNFIQQSKVVSSWIDKRKYADVDVIGLSYGAIPALAMSNVKKDYDYHLVIPLLDVYQPRTIATKLGNKRLQQYFENDLYGSKKNMFSLSEAVFRWREAQNVKINYYFASNDLVSSEESLSSKEKESGFVSVFSGTHENVTLRPEIWESLRLNISAL